MCSIEFRDAERFQNWELVKDNNKSTSSRWPTSRRGMEMETWVHPYANNYIHAFACNDSAWIGQGLCISMCKQVTWLVLGKKGLNIATITALCKPELLLIKQICWPTGWLGFPGGNSMNVFFSWSESWPEFWAKNQIEKDGYPCCLRRCDAPNKIHRAEPEKYF